MKEQFKITVKNADIKEENGIVKVMEKNNKGEVVSERTLDDIYDRISDKEFLKFQIASNDEIGNADVKEVINKFIGRTGIGFTITNEIES